jgi:hypothetical protein
MLAGDIRFEWLREILKLSPASGGVVGRPHAGITQDGILSRYPKYFNLKELTATTKKARCEIEVGSEAVDGHNNRLLEEAEAEKSECDFDDETFQARRNSRFIQKEN